MSATQKTSPAAQLIHKLSKLPADAPVSVKTPTALRKKRRLETDETLADPSLSDLPMEATLNPHDLPGAVSADMANSFGPLAAAPGGIETDAGSHSPMQLSQLDIPVAPETSALTAAPESGALIAAPAAAAGLGMSSLFAGVAVVGVASGGGGGNTSAGIKSDVKTSEPPIKIAGTFKGLTFDETVIPVSTGQAGGSVERTTQLDGNHILKFDKGAGSAGQYAHITLSTDKTSTIPKVDPISFATGDSKLGMWVHTAQAGTKVRLQIGDSAAGGYPNDKNWVEVETLTTKAGWDYVTFDFESPSSRFVANGAADGSRGYTDAIALKNSVTYDMVTVFFDLGVSKLSAETYYLDNLTPVALKNATPPAPIDYSTTNPIPAGYKLVLSDEFDSDVTAISPDTQKWKLETGKGPNGDGWGNGESQVYESGLDDAFLKDGALHIIAKRTGDTITSARLKSQLGDTLDPYGYVEVRAKLPAETGAWPAIWLLGQGEWPKTGEIDIVEWSARYFNDQQVQGALHFLGDNNTTKRTYGDTEFKASTTLADTIENFHTYQLWWTPEFIRIGVDGNINTAYFEYSKPANATANNWPFSNPMDMILNLAVGGTLGGDVPSGNFQYEMVVDYVRVYQTDPLASRPTTAPAAPTAAADTVVSLFSEAYTTTAGFDMPKWGPSKLLSDTTIASNHVLMGDAFTFQGFQFDAFDANTKNLGKLHLDIWSKDATPVNVYVISDGQHSEFVTITPTAGAWKGVDIDLSAFTKIDKTKIFQVKLDTMIQPTTKEMYFDNIYFAKADATTTPTDPTAPVLAPTKAPVVPTLAAENVLSFFSDSYNNVTVNTWSADWDAADVATVSLENNPALKYTNLGFAGIEFTTAPVDATQMTHLHLDVWKENPSSVFKIKLVDFGANGVYQGAVNDDVEHELLFNIAGKPSMAGNQWVSVDIPLSEMTGLSTRAHLAQMIISGSGAGDTVWVDNVYLHNSAAVI